MLIHTDLLLERDCGPSSKKIHVGFKTPLGWPHQDLLTEKNRLPYVSSLVGFGPCDLYVYSDLAYV